MAKNKSENKIKINNYNETKTYYFYKYTNLAHINKKIYIGQTTNPQKRKISHHWAALSGSEECPRFYHAIRKYGYENFAYEIICMLYGTQKEADDTETYLIKYLNAKNRDFGMNVANGGRGGACNQLECNTDTHTYCPHCKEIKLRECFDKNSDTNDGLGTYCKSCIIEMRNEWWNSLSEEEKEIKRKVEREYRASVSIEVKERRNKRYRDRNIIYRKENEKLTYDEIYARTPIKFCPGCKMEIASINFYINLSKKRGLTDKCKTCLKNKTKEKKIN